jgi:hypothetical protein
MEIEERIKALEDEFANTKEETRQLMMDIRALLMEASSPLRSQSGGTKTSDPNDLMKG